MGEHSSTAPTSTATANHLGVSYELSKEQRKEAANWISSHPGRLQSMQAQFASIAPQQNRKPGWTNDQVNERDLASLPFASVVAPTLIALGANDAVIPVEHATTAVEKTPNADLVLVEEGHHILSLSRHYGPVARRQLQLAQV